MFTDVLVVGAGPTGLMLANQLGRRGIRPIIIDRHSGPAQQSRAMAVHARTLEIYAKLGIADRAIELGRPGYGANMWSGGKLRARVPFKGMGTGLSAFPYVLMLGQDDNERILGDLLRRWNVDIQWNTELVALEQSATDVKATLRRPDGTTSTITAAYVAGCDGARSSVREMLGIKFPGAPYEHVFFVADTEAQGPMVPDELNVYLWRTGFHLYFPMHGTDRWRVIGILPKPLRGRRDLSFDDLVPTLLHQGGSHLSFKSCSWMSTYRIHHRCTERFGNGRCFLLGDAAHVHSPMGGQGMNTGLQDAYNLAWKLSAVVTKQAPPTLLASYEDERRPVALRLLTTTDRAFRFVVAENWVAAIFRTQIMPALAAAIMRQETVRKKLFPVLSQIGISYRESPLSLTVPGVDAQSPQAGDRFPWLHLRLRANGPREDLFAALDDTRFNVLVFGQEGPDESSLFGPNVTIHVVPDDEENRTQLAQVSIIGPAFYLLRPDGHVAVAGIRLDREAVLGWFAKHGVKLARTKNVETVMPAERIAMAAR